MSLQTLKETRAAKVAEMRTINETALAANRDLSGEEKKRFDALDTETRSITSQIERQEKLDALDRQIDGGNTQQALPELRSYSLSKAIMEGSNGGLTGLEAEVHQELARGRSEVRGVMVPTDAILETRAMTTATPAGGPGSNMIATDLAAMTDRRRSALKIESMGATILRGLTGNLDLPRLSKSGTSHWIGEHTDTTRSDSEFSKSSMGPKTVSAEYEISRRMMLQASQAIDPILRADLAYLLSQSLDTAAIKGGGTDEPTGILSDTNITATASAGNDLGTDTSLLMRELEVDDVTGTRAFLTHPAVAHEARISRDTTEQPLPTDWMWHGERRELSTNVPSDLGAASDEYALIYGEWASLYLGYWSGVDLMLNPYHSDVASKGGALIHAFLDCDVLVRHPEAFAYTSRKVSV